MALEIFKLFGSVMVNNDEANKSIAKTTDNAEGLGSKLVSGAGTALKFGVAIGTAAIAGGVALFGLANKSAEATDRIDKLSNKIGISKQGFQEWDYIMGQNGMDVEKLQVGVKTLVTQMDAAAGGSKKAAASFGKLGVSWQDGNGKLKSQEVMMNESIMALAKMENGTEKAKLATELFGKAGIEMMPMLNNGAEGITDLKDRAHELGLVLSDEAVTSGVVLGDTMDDVKDSFGAVATKIGVQVMPLVQKALDWLLDKMPTIQAVASVVFGVVSDVIGVVGNIIENYLMPALSNMWAWLQPNIPIIKEFVVNAFDAIKDALSNVSDFISVYLVPAFNDFWAWLQPNIPLIKEIVQSAFDTMKSAVSGVVDVLKSVIDWCIKYQEILIPLAAGIVAGATVFGIYSLAIGIAAAATGIWATITGIATGVGAAFGAVLAFITSPIGLVVLAIGLLIAIGVLLYRNWDTIKEVAMNVFSAIGDFIGGVVDKIGDVFSGLADTIIAPFRSAIDSIKNIWSTMKSIFKLPHFNFTGSMNPIDWIDEGMPSVGVEWYAKGGIMNSPTMFGRNGNNAMVGGEAGPEAIAPISTLMDYIRTAVGESNNIDYDRLADILMKSIQTGFSNIGIYLGKEEVGQAMADTTDRINGNRVSLTERGVFV